MRHSGTFKKIIILAFSASSFLSVIPQFAEADCLAATVGISSIFKPKKSSVTYSFGAAAGYSVENRKMTLVGTSFTAYQSSDAGIQTADNRGSVSKVSVSGSIKKVPESITIRGPILITTNTGQTLQMMLEIKAKDMHKVRGKLKGSVVAKVFDPNTRHVFIKHKAINFGKNAGVQWQWRTAPTCSSGGGGKR